MRNIDAYNVISKPILTSKIYTLRKSNTYVFFASVKKNKVNIKKSLEILFKTQIKKLCIAYINKKKKKRAGIKRKRKKNKKFFVNIDRKKQIT